jgi:hypothetical protein
MKTENFYKLIIVALTILSIVLLSACSSNNEEQCNYWKTVEYQKIKFYYSDVDLEYRAHPEDHQKLLDEVIEYLDVCNNE